ncbi:Glucan 1,3-beta-glucosidase [Cytospora mali]|uniref:Glucan 1,3-beta-glucosidase n=1 Tax=Cytospora mali TaxID=578113 RepID=A0A194UXG7_CYTMA|nr:Glucan 1,3-beta-glucosidase [Valsa mali var. pyri (nom. inval.)]
MIFTKLITSVLMALPALAAPAANPRAAASTSSGYWVADIARNGAVPFGNDSSYAIFRNVMDYGAKGDGSTDDTDAINKAISDGNRCGEGCGSTTTAPAIVYFPAGTYMVNKPIIQYYYTQMVGDANDLPILKAMSTFTGMAVIDSDPYDDDGASWYVNQNNFFRQVRNFQIDLTELPYTSGAGIHWQVAQATSLQNIVFNMRTDGGSANIQKGIFMDNGSGGFMSDLTFIGGGTGMWVGNQQFTTRNMTFSNCQTAIFINWDWVWTIKDVTINNCQVGLDVSTGGSTDQTVGSALFLDSTISNTPIGVNSSYSTTQTGTNGTLIIDNVDMTNNVQTAIHDATTSTAVLAGNQVVSNFVQGNTVHQSGTAVQAIQAAQSNVTKPESLLNSAGAVYTRSKPQYESLPSSSFVSAKAYGLKGDGTTDDTVKMQAFLNSVTTDQVAYFDHGAYIVTDTIKVPKDIKITGEVWPMIMAKGSNFADMSNPRPVFQVGQAGETGAVELSDLIFQTAGPVPGAIMIEWNLKASSQGAAGMWDVHNRIGGSAGTSLLSEQCAKNNGTTHGANEACEGTFLMMHITSAASDVYLENTWFWVADHDLEPAANSAQIDIYNGRGVLIESQGPVWLYGTASEHSVMYNYQLSNASAVYMALIQTETAYFQGNPAAPAPFVVNATWNDPAFSNTTSATSARTWGLRVIDSEDVFVYGAGLYSFFDNYNQDCLATESCQDNMVSFENSVVHMYGLSTKASVNMLTVDGVSRAIDSDNRNTFCATLSYFSSAA